MFVRLARAAVLGLALGASGCATVSQNLYATSAVEEAAWPYATPTLHPEKEVVWGVLPNGLRYAILPNKTPKRSVSLRLHIAAGSLDETDDQQGLAHFLEHMAFNGSKNVPEGDMVKILERFGLAFGPDTNAFTSFDQTVYQLDLPSNGDAIVDQGLSLLNETARNLTLAPDSIDRERGVIKSELRLRDTPAYRAYVAGAKFVMPDARLTQRLPIGQKQIIEGAPRSAFEELYKRAYRPDRALLVVTGDIDAAKIAEKVNGRFSDWTKDGKADETPKAGPIKAGELDAGYFFDPEVKTSIAFSFIKPPTDPKDSLAERKTSMMRDLANAVFSRRLRALARHADAKILGGAGYFDDSYHAADMSVLMLSAEPKNWREALTVGEQELRRAVTYGFSKAEVDEQLSEMRASYRNAAEYAPTRKTADLADALVAAAHDKSVFTHPDDDLALFESFARGVSAKTLSQAFRADWSGAEPRIFLVSSAKIDNARESILAAYKQSRAQAVAKPKRTSSDAFAYTKFGAPGVVAEQKEVADLAS
ncbi:MAG: insulinase family protein, partial [Caulobacterales bacterium]